MHLDNALIDFFLNEKVNKLENLFYSENRGEAIGRLSKVYSFLKTHKVAEPLLSKIVACVGEVSNNAFDHNLGYWNSKPGCLLAFWTEAEAIVIGVVDRGRGIVASLKTALDPSFEPQKILEAAFEEIISGRVPEKRGNGLKFVVSQIRSSEKNSLFCLSAGEIYQIGPSFFKPNQVMLRQAFGTFVLMRWSTK